MPTRRKSLRVLMWGLPVLRMTPDGVGRADRRPAGFGPAPANTWAVETATRKTSVTFDPDDSRFTCHERFSTSPVPSFDEGSDCGRITVRVHAPRPRSRLARPPSPRSRVAELVNRRGARHPLADAAHDDVPRSRASATSSTSIVPAVGSQFTRCGHPRGSFRTGSPVDPSASSSGPRGESGQLREARKNGGVPIPGALSARGGSVRRY